jgi:Ca2+-binding EF-hand superfamily protein
MQQDIMNAAWEHTRSIRVLADTSSSSNDEPSTFDQVGIEFGEVFDAYDSDRSGLIDWSELSKLAETAGFESAALKGIFESQVRQTEGKKGLNRETFILLCRKVFPLSQMKQPNRLHLKTRLDLLRLFQRHDLNLSGFVEWTEFEALVRDIAGLTRTGTSLTGPQERELWHVFDQTDTNRDHKISFDEFCGGLFRIAGALQDPDSSRDYPPLRPQQPPRVASQVVRVVRAMPVPVPIIIHPYNGFLPLFPPPGMCFPTPMWRPRVGSPFSSANLLRAHRLSMMRPRF